MDLGDYSRLDELQSFSLDLRKIVQEASSETITIDEIETVLHGRGITVFILILAIPFVQPIPLPGLSILFGVVIFALGLRLAIGERTRLPRIIRTKTIDTRLLKKLINATFKLYRYVDKFFHCRAPIFFKKPFRSFVGLSIMLGGLGLSLPLPPVIPFSNALPALSVVLVALGYLERDGVAVALGYFMTIVTYGYFAFWWEAVRYAFQSMMNYI